jgi:hypothetical protein
MRRKRTAVLVAANIVQLDPVDCGSTVGYKIVRGRNLWAELDLSDCNRKIQWSFYSIDGLGKIDRAIEMLTKFRTDWASAIKKVPRKRRRKTT